MNDNFDLPDLALGWLTLIFIWLVVFGVLATIAALVAPEGRRGTFFLLTFFILGPLGVGFASVAPARPPRAKVSWHYSCEKCGAIQNVEHGTKTADCYRCGDLLF
jgi:hypothetical protein